MYLALMAQMVKNLLAMWETRFPGNGNPLQYSCLDSSMNKGAWCATVHGVKKSWTWLSHFHFHRTDETLGSFNMGETFTVLREIYHSQKDKYCTVLLT